MKPTEPCPCSSGRKYADCCAPYHRLEREPPDAAALMRSRYAAFAAGEVDYLLRTLHPDHDDARRPANEVLAELREAVRTLRYTGLRVLDAREPDAEGVARVLFLARVFRRGQDLSFVELSDFARAGGGWRYLCGDAAPASAFPDPGALKVDSFKR